MLDWKMFPEGHGVYLMKDADGRVLYVGKAKNLRKRIKSYFGRESGGRYQIKFLMEKTADISFIETAGEKEAVLLEYKLIQKHKPKYNIDLKDDKTFVSIRLSAGHPFPSISVTRRVKKDGAAYFGPYVPAGLCRLMFDQAAKFFGLRTCSDNEFRNRSRPCIQYDIGRCPAPCTGLVAKEAYIRKVKEAELFLKGRNRELLRKLGREMKEASLAMDFEEAGRIRDVISGIKGLLEKQSVMKPEALMKPETSNMKPETDYVSVIGASLKKRLHLPQAPRFIECVDISNIHGETASGAVAAFLDGAPFKKGYRLFNITKTDYPNDYAMMYEVLERRFRHAEWGLPDLLMVDGGRGHLAVAKRALENLGICGLPAAAIAKVEGSHRRSGDTAQVFLPNRVNPVKFRKGEASLLYLIRIRDETHRFCIAHFRRRHSKRSFSGG